ncbi:MAG: alkaline phosphatase family protein [Bacteroidota bacterium]
MLPRSKRLAKKVLLIGWDAADWKVISPMLDAGLMPALNGLIERGVMGNLATLDPPLSPMLWTSIATGKTADQHGILNFTQPAPDGSGIKPVLTTSRKVKAVWNMFSQLGMHSNIVGWWPSHPAEPINGVMVSNFYQKATGKIDEEWKMAPGTVYPERLEEDLAELRIHPGELTGAHILPFVPRAGEVDMSKDKRLGNVIKEIAHASTIQAAATHLMETEPWDFMAVYFDTIDHFGHGFMRFHPPKMDGVPDDLYELYHNVVVAGYRYHDMMLDRMLTLAGEDTTVILMSDHGFHSDHLRPKNIPKEPAGPAVEHRNLGIFVMAGPGVQQDERIYGASLFDIAPTVLTLFGLPIGRDMRGRPLASAFEEPLEPAYIDSWEDFTDGQAGMHAEEVRSDPWAEQAAMDQLVALGYVDPPGENAEKALKVSTNESQYYLARVYLSTGRPEQAIEILAPLYEQNPDQDRFGQRLALAYQKVDRLAEARTTIEQLIERKSARDKGKKRPMPWIDYMLGSMLLVEGETEQALEHLEKAERAEPRMPSLHNQIGQAYLKSGKLDLAERAFRKAITIDPEGAAAHHGIGRVHLRKGEHIEAAEALLRAVGIAYRQPAAHYHLGEALAKLGYYDRAAEAFQVAVSQAPGMKRAHLYLAELYRNYLDEPKKAAAHTTFAAERIV